MDYENEYEYVSSMDVDMDVPKHKHLFLRSMSRTSRQSREGALRLERVSCCDAMMVCSLYFTTVYFKRDIQCYSTRSTLELQSREVCLLFGLLSKRSKIQRTTFSLNRERLLKLYKHILQMIRQTNTADSVPSSLCQQQSQHNPFCSQFELALQTKHLRDPHGADNRSYNEK